jgi:hypothetical protein
MNRNKTRNKSVGFLVLVMLGVSGLSTKSSAAQTTGTSQGEWVIETVDSIGTFPGGPSLALTSDDAPYLFYNLEVENINRLARRSGTTWAFETISSSASFYQTVVKIDSTNIIHLSFLSDLTNGISYWRSAESGWTNFFVPGTTFSSYPIIDATMTLDSAANPVFGFYGFSEFGALETKFRKGIFINGTMTWLDEIGYSEDGSLLNSNLGLQVPESGSPHFITSIQMNDGTLQIRRTYLGSHTPSNTIWLSDSIETIGENQFSVGYRLDKNEIDHIVYLDRAQGALKYATNNLEENSEDLFTTQIIDSIQISTFNADFGEPISIGYLDPFFDISLAVDQAGSPHVVYPDPQNNILKYAHLVNGQWIVQTIEAVGGDNVYSDLAIDSKGNPVVAYSNALYPDNKIRFARFVPNPISQTTPTDSTENVIAYPNPFRPSTGIPEMTFSDIPVDSKIKLYTLTGELIRELTANPSGQAPWNGKNEEGEDVASGVYVAFVEGNGGKKNIKVAVQR